MRYNAKKDLNHNTVFDYMRGKGWAIGETWQLGHGYADGIACSAGWFSVWVEVKKDEKEPLTPAEKKFFENFPGLKVKASTGESAHEQCSALYRKFATGASNAG